MPIALSDIQKLTPSEKIELYHFLENDPDVVNDELNETDEVILFQEIEKRDELYRQGNIRLTTIADLEKRLQIIS